MTEEKVDFEAYLKDRKMDICFSQFRLNRKERESMYGIKCSECKYEKRCKDGGMTNDNG